MPRHLEEVSPDPSLTVVADPLIGLRASTCPGCRRCAHPARELTPIAEIGERTFAEWLASQGGAKRKADANEAQVVDALWPLVQQGALAIPRGGYRIRRGRGRIIVGPARS